jgi:hypothetical protein
MKHEDGCVFHACFASVFRNLDKHFFFKFSHFAYQHHGFLNGAVVKLFDNEGLDYQVMGPGLRAHIRTLFPVS